MEIASWMTRDPVTIGPDERLASAKTLMEAGRFRRLPVVDSGKLVGIITERDLRQHEGYLDSTRVNAAMTAKPITVPPSTSADEVARLMLKHKIGGLPIVENHTLVGIISTSDLLRALLGVIEATGHMMDP